VLGSDALLRVPSTLLVTHFREPIARLNSEYWFKGPGSKSSKLHVHVANESLWLSWMNMSRPQPAGVAPAFTEHHGVNYNAGVYFGK
jgi:hypothetical protein